MPFWPPILPIFPFYGLRFEIMVPRRADRGKDALFTDLLEDLEPFELVLHQVFELGEAQLWGE